jgi:NAD(P)-dependent dehydrogenase (short-subunit alcohol dehydrogenase family)
MSGESAGASRAALITGASRGLGLVLARFLAAQGYRLILTARDPGPLDDAARELSKLTEVHALSGDVRDAGHRRALAGVSGERLQLLINNASDLGIAPLPPLLAYDLERLRQLFDANAIAPLALVQATAPALARARGLVVNLSSDAARGGYRGWGGYGASKAALDLIGLTLSNEVAGFGVVQVDPGDMRTTMHQAAYPGEDISDRPLPEATIPFWAWLLEQDGETVNGRRFEAQADVWELA